MDDSAIPALAGNVFATVSYEYCRVDRATALKYPPQGEPRISWPGAHITTSASRMALRKQLASMGKNPARRGGPRREEALTVRL